jgi:lysophospholipase L1-like esterase
VEIVATMGTVITRSPGAELTGVRTGPFGRWADGVIAMREDCAAFAGYWQAHNAEVSSGTGPLWVVLGDSTAQGLGAPAPDGGYVGQVLAALRQHSGQPWRVMNLSVSGAVIQDVLDGQLPGMPARTDLVTCGIGINDILYTAPAKLFAGLRFLAGALPDGTVMLDIPVPAGVWGPFGRMGVPYVTRINRVLDERARARGLRVARVSERFTPPWEGKFARDRFHPSQDGYRDWTGAVLDAIGQQQTAA